MKTLLKGALVIGAMLTGVVGAHAQSFGNAYFFGDSLTDCCVTGRYTNDKAPNWADEVAPAIGASYVATLNTDKAVGGAQTGQKDTIASLEVPGGSGFLPQTQRFVAEGLSISSRDIAGIWIGTNDIWPSAQATSLANQPIGARPAVATLVDYMIGNVRTGVNTLVNQGFRSIILVSPYDLGVSNIYNGFGSNDAATRALATQYSEAYRDALANLYTPGVNTYFLDTLTLLRRVQSDPALYGFEYVTADENCKSIPACLTAPVAVQNRYLFNDTIHTTSGFDQLMANYIANTINARTSLPAQGDLGQEAGQAFSDILLDRLDAYRDINSAAAAPALTGRSVAPSAIPVLAESPFSLFAEGAYADINRNARVTPVGPSNTSLGADFAGITAGLEYRAIPNLLVGTAFNYFKSSVDLGGPSQASIDFASYQGGVFASYNRHNLFVDGAVTYGVNTYGLTRPGVIDTLTASPTGNTFTAAGKIGYLFDYGTFRVGPIGELTYANVQIGSYDEGGDSLLTLGVRGQNFNGLTGGAGFQLRTTLSLLGAQASPFLNVTAQYDFLDGLRTITSFSTDAPALLINTSAGQRGEDVYGKVSGGLAADLGYGLNGVVSGSATFGRSYGNDYALNLGLKYRL